MKGHKLVTLVDPANELSAGDAVTVELASPLYFDEAGRRLEPVQPVSALAAAGHDRSRR
jgi:hypothetical protein